MKKILIGVFMLALITLGIDVFAQKKAPFHIGVVTGTVSQSEDDLRGAEALIKEYGSVKDGGMIQHITYPDDFMSQQETFISNVVAFADDKAMKAIIVNQGIPGTAEAFKRVHAKRPDILLLVGESHEDPLVIQGSGSRRFCRLCFPWIHHHLGCKTTRCKKLRSYLVPPPYEL
jgi:hypothetical protein